MKHHEQLNEGRPSIPANELEEWLHLDELRSFTSDFQPLNAVQSAFIWTHDGYRASRTRESAAGSGLAYKYELFKNQALMLHSTEHYQGNGIKTFGYYDDGKSQFGYWADSFDSMDSDSLDAIQTKTHEPVIKWEETDFRRLRSHILEEERYRITEQLLRPPKNKDEIIARQNMIDCMIHLTDFERLVEIKNASYDAMIGNESPRASARGITSFKLTCS